MVLEKVVRIDNIGKFTRLLPRGDVQFRRLNLLYGPNGHGKTTLAGILRSLQTGDPAYVSERARLGGGAPLVQLKVAGGMASFEHGRWNQAAPGLEVFDTTFVSENVHAGDHVELEQRKNLYQVVVGAAAVALARRIDDIDSEGREVLRNSTGLENKLRELIQAPFSVDDFIRLEPEEGVAERIAEVTSKLSAARRSKEVLARLGPDLLRLPDMPEKALDVLKTSVEHISVEAEKRVREHFGVRLDHRGEQWVRQGLEYLRDDTACPFCTQTTEKVELVGLFRKYFSAGYREHVASIERALSAVEQALGDQALHGLQKSVQENDARIRVWADLVDLRYAQASPSGFEAAVRRLRGLLLGALRAKLANPSAVVPDNDELEAALRDYRDARAALTESNKAIGRAADAVGEAKKSASSADEGALEKELRRLRNIQIRERDDAKALCTALQEARQTKKKLDEEKRAKRKELEDVSEEILSKYEASINRLLANFGASFRITGTKPSFPGGKASSTYRISIDNQALDLGDSKTPRGVPCFRTALSAGDKSTLALAFFLARLRGDAELGKKTVIFDDPLSSLDNFRTSCTRNEVCWIAQNAAQTVVLSHDGLFLKAIYDSHDKASMKVLEVARDGAEYLLREWNVDRYCRHETHLAYFNLRRYLDSGLPEHADLRVIASDIRVYLEGSLRHRFPEDFAADKWLGEFIALIRAAPPGSRLAVLKAKLPDLEAVNAYSAPFHHAGQAVTTPPNDTELRAHVERAIATIQGP